MKCEDCKFWVGAGDYGECHRYPPVIVTEKPNGYADVGEEPEDYLGELPCSFNDQWCGEFEAKDK